MSWAKKRKTPKVASEERDISKMTRVICKGCKCMMGYTMNPPKTMTFCKECEEERKKYNIPW